ncbi:MAG TPA: Nif3-like dinuclear metal center hexameric protein [Gaiellaceae bacterium]|jgi:dinuclear metal center YbgI/SA1388 family protein|nr:Nif3-like dinuclear metal center hexameric protein [Gaiellaceae bacterium]HEX2433665.1 Nif3-like dinuclear metal center hexameric protein [Gaiellaceae bacterium]
MAARDEVLDFARELLDLDSFDDYGPMGLQVVGADEVTKIAAGVSSSRELFDRAAQAGAELLIVHHGLFWDNDPRVVDRQLKVRLQALFAGDVTLAAYHLALDAHPEIGNNALLARELGIKSLERVLEWGFGGRLEPSAGVDELAGRLEQATGQEPQVFEGGPERIERVAVITGGAARLFPQIAALGYDAFVTGEPAEPTLHAAQELGTHFLAGGHYATETFGIKALAERLAERFDLEWEFLDLPNPV